MLHNCAIKVRGLSVCFHLQLQGEVWFISLISCGIFCFLQLLVFHVWVCPRVLGMFWLCVEDSVGVLCAFSGVNTSYIAVVCSCERLEADLCFYISAGESLDYLCRYLHVQTQDFPVLGHAVSKCHFRFCIAASSKPTPCSVGGAGVQINVLRGVLFCSVFSLVSTAIGSAWWCLAAEGDRSIRYVWFYVVFCTRDRKHKCYWWEIIYITFALNHHSEHKT